MGWVRNQGTIVISALNFDWGRLWPIAEITARNKFESHQKHMDILHQSKLLRFESSISYSEKQGDTKYKNKNIVIVIAGNSFDLLTSGL